MSDVLIKRNADGNITSSDVKSNSTQPAEFGWQDCFNLLINNPLQDLLFISNLLDISNNNGN